MDKKKLFITAIAVVLLGAIALFGVTKLQPSKDASQEAMFEQLEFNGKAREACAEAIKTNTKYELSGLMFDHEGDGRSNATFIWRGEGKKGEKSTWELKDNNFERLACKFERGKGVVSLAADDQVVWSEGGPPR